MGQHRPEPLLAGAPTRQTSKLQHTVLHAQRVRASCEWQRLLGFSQMKQAFYARKSLSFSAASSAVAAVSLFSAASSAVAAASLFSSASLFSRSASAVPSW